MSSLPENGGEPQSVVMSPQPPAPEPPVVDQPIVDLAAVAFVMGLLVLGVALMLAMGHH